AFNWSAIEPTTDLRYQPCFHDFRCARLKVPLDWQNSNSTKSVAVAIVSLPAVVPESDPSFGGTIISNPGGPGDSGVVLMLEEGKQLQKFLDNNKHYEILSFDPRGVNNTTPPVDCFGDTEARLAFQFEERGMGAFKVVNTADGLAGLARQQALRNIHGAVCESREQVEPISAYVSTASVARDMLEIVDQVDKLRRSTLNTTKSCNGTSVPRLQYYGLSYGTHLGNTFASMFPGRVGRMILDGVVDSDDYVQVSLPRVNLLDFDKIVDVFYDTCHNQTDCPLKQDGDSSGGDIRKRVDAHIASLDLEPAPLLAMVLAAALQGQYAAVAEFLLPDGHSPDNSESGLHILCADSANATGYNLTFWSDYIKDIEDQSPLFGPAWANYKFTCSGWRITPNFQYTGPFGTPPPKTGKPDPKAPSAPLLFFSNRLDPVTPLRNALRMSSLHPNSSVVIQESAGHCAFQAAYSSCTTKIARDYFEFGTVPANGTTCDTGC
ncbi:hypothetical protein GQ53DRAFT_625425, partial [Thozetella sp. PMI_491]